MAFKCEQFSGNMKKCNCSYEPCERKGNCCACIHYHLAMNELPACAFSNEAERSWDRSFENFIRDKKEK